MDEMTTCICGKKVRASYYTKHLKTTIHNKRLRVKEERVFRRTTGKVFIHFD